MTMMLKKTNKTPPIGTIAEIVLTYFMDGPMLELSCMNSKASRSVDLTDRQL